jgi:hypothetical protein
MQRSNAKRRSDSSPARFTSGVVRCEIIPAIHLPAGLADRIGRGCDRRGNLLHVKDQGWVDLIELRARAVDRVFSSFACRFAFMRHGPCVIS